MVHESRPPKSNLRWKKMMIECHKEAKTKTHNFNIGKDPAHVTECHWSVYILMELPAIMMFAIVKQTLWKQVLSLLKRTFYFITIHL